MKIEYNVPEEDAKTWFVPKKDLSSCSTNYMAEVCAKDYYYSHQGSKSSWPLKLTIKKDGEVIG